MCGDPARVVVKMLNARRCAWPWRERIVTGENSIATMHHDADDKGSRVTFKRGSEREDQVIVALAGFLVLHETIRDRRERAEKERRSPGRPSMRGPGSGCGSCRTSRRRPWCECCAWT